MRMVFNIVPIPGITEVDHKTAQERKVYLKIKKAYNPFFMIANFAPIVKWHNTSMVRMSFKFDS